MNPHGLPPRRESAELLYWRRLERHNKRKRRLVAYFKLLVEMLLFLLLVAFVGIVLNVALL